MNRHCPTCECREVLTLLDNVGLESTLQQTIYPLIHQLKSRLVFCFAETQREPQENILIFLRTQLGNEGPLCPSILSCPSQPFKIVTVPRTMDIG